MIHVKTLLLLDKFSILFVTINKESEYIALSEINKNGLVVFDSDRHEKVVN